MRQREALQWTGRSNAGRRTAQCIVTHTVMNQCVGHPFPAGCGSHSEATCNNT